MNNSHILSGTEIYCSSIINTHTDESTATSEAKLQDHTGWTEMTDCHSLRRLQANEALYPVYVCVCVLSVGVCATTVSFNPIWHAAYCDRCCPCPWL